MKITVNQLRRIIKEEVASVTQARASTRKGVSKRGGRYTPGLTIDSDAKLTPASLRAAYDGEIVYDDDDLVVAITKVLQPAVDKGDVVGFATFMNMILQGDRQGAMNVAVQFIPS